MVTSNFWDLRSVAPTRCSSVISASHDAKTKEKLKQCHGELKELYTTITDLHSLLLHLVQPPQVNYTISGLRAVKWFISQTFLPLNIHFLQVVL